MARNIVTIDDLTNDEIEKIFLLADEFLAELGRGADGRPHVMSGRLKLASGCILSTLFYEPSTRTRFSFESAMHRLGGHVLSSADPATTSAAKGESIADTIRVVENYADCIVIRHPMEGAARVAADYASIPIINAGDGGHEHPTQTLTDLYTLRREKGQLAGLNVQLRGDLQHARTVHSLVCALARFGAYIFTSPAPGLDLPPHVVRRLERDFQCVPLRDVEGGLPEDVDKVYVSGAGRQESLPNLPADFLIEVTSKGLSRRDFRKIDIFYVTRLQAERFKDSEHKGEYPIVDASYLKDRRYKESRVMHPLPRVGELDYDLDKDDRAVYFKQAAYGVPVRMALLATLLGLKDPEFAREAPAKAYPVYTRRGGIACNNPFCVTRNESERHYLAPRFWIVDDTPMLRCGYCEHETMPRCVGRVSTQRYDCDASRWKQIPLDDLIMFEDESSARPAGYQPYKQKTGSR